PVVDSALILTDFKSLLPNSTLLYCIHACAVLRIVFQPLNVFAVSIKVIDVPTALFLLYRSICILRIAFVRPIPRKVGITLRIVPSSLKNKLSALMERALSKFGERSL